MSFAVIETGDILKWRREEVRGEGHPKTNKTMLASQLELHGSHQASSCAAEGVEGLEM